MKAGSTAHENEKQAPIKKQGVSYEERSKSYLWQ